MLGEGREHTNMVIEEAIEGVPFVLKRTTGMTACLGIESFSHLSSVFPCEVGDENDGQFQSSCYHMHCTGEDTEAWR